MSDQAEHDKITIIMRAVMPNYGGSTDDTYEKERAAGDAILADLSAMGWDLVKRDPFAAVGLTPPRTDHLDVELVSRSSDQAGVGGATFRVRGHRFEQLHFVQNHTTRVLPDGTALHGEGTLTQDWAPAKPADPPAPILLKAGQECTVAAPYPRAGWDEQEIDVVPGDRLYVITERDGRARVRCPASGFDGWLDIALLCPIPDGTQWTRRVTRRLDAVERWLDQEDEGWRYGHR